MIPFTPYNSTKFRRMKALGKQHLRKDTKRRNLQTFSCSCASLRLLQASGRGKAEIFTLSNSCSGCARPDSYARSHPRRMLILRGACFITRSDVPCKLYHKRKSKPQGSDTKGLLYRAAPGELTSGSGMATCGLGRFRVSTAGGFLEPGWKDFGGFGDKVWFRPSSSGPELREAVTTPPPPFPRAWGLGFLVPPPPPPPPPPPQLSNSCRNTSLHPEHEQAFFCRP